MQLQIANDLTVNGISYNAIRMIEMQSSRNMPIDQLKVEFANKYYDNNTFSVGDSVVWTGGYTKEAQTEFTGEITEIKSFHPLTIMAKDNMIKLKESCVQGIIPIYQLRLFLAMFYRVELVQKLILELNPIQ